ncbi:MAG: hypothetical protein IK014_04550 [Lachnospiraceae bacterium]|nr:hypothetical protein [Lachnospiraceae bacterium]
MVDKVAILDYIGYMDSQLIDEAYEGLHKRKIHTRIAKVSLIAASIIVLCIVSINKFVFPLISTTNDVEPGSTLPGADEIYPTVLVDGVCYSWRIGKAIININTTDGSFAEPDQYLEDKYYYGEIVNGNASVPENDRELVCSFDVSGSIYTDPNDEDVVYLKISTDWMKDAVVVFDRVE